MSIPLNDNIATLAPKPSDSRYGPYASVSDALAAIPESQRHLGLTVGVGTTTVTDYWFKDGVADLVAKAPATVQGLYKSIGVDVDNNPMYGSVYFSGSFPNADLIVDNARLRTLGSIYCEGQVFSDGAVSAVSVHASESFFGDGSNLTNLHPESVYNQNGDLKISFDTSGSLLFDGDCTFNGSYLAGINGLRTEGSADTHFSPDAAIYFGDHIRLVPTSTGCRIETSASGSFNDTVIQQIFG